MLSIFTAISQRFRRFARKFVETIAGLATVFSSWSLKDALSALREYFRETGRWYLGSAAVHALALMALALISLAAPGMIISRNNQAPSFNAAETQLSKPPEISEIFEIGDAPLEPTNLDDDASFEAMPIAPQTEIFYDDSPEFVEAGGGFNTDQKGPQLGGLGGLSAMNLPGPAGRGGVGVGSGLSNRPGFGGQGEGFGFRGQGHRAALLGSQGGTKATDRAVLGALNWLHRHQAPNGRWSLDFRTQCRKGVCSGPGMLHCDEAATAMALLPFLARGQTHKLKGLYQQTVAKGIAWLIKQEKPDGCLYGNDTPQPMYSQGLATLVLCELYGMSRDEHVGLAARKAVAFIERAQNSTTGGWRYFPGDPGDISVTGWQVMALKSAILAGLPVNSLVFDNSKKFLRSVAKGEHLGLYSYRPYDEVNPSRTAIGMLCTQYLGIDPKDPSMFEGKAYLLENLPDDKLYRNAYYWYYATLVMHNFGHAEWDLWNRKMRWILIKSQEKKGCATGSWNPMEPAADAWGEQGGRLMVTAFNALTLEVYYRYLPLFRTDSLVPEQPKKPKEKDEAWQ
ncbi:MAG: prenyltransferase/squalene oxidase repeat-containing protein [Thermoguttaceae bacterium]